MEFTIKTVTDKILTIETNNQKIINHFNDPKNHTGIILEQMNEENLYQKWIMNLCFFPIFHSLFITNNGDRIFYMSK